MRKEYLSMYLPTTIDCNRTDNVSDASFPPVANDSRNLRFGSTPRRKAQTLTNALVALLGYVVGGE